MLQQLHKIDDKPSLVKLAAVGFEPSQPTKRCARCGEVKPLDDFYRRSRSRDNPGVWCKSCSDERRQVPKAIYDATERQIAKECSHCHQVKALVEFNHDARSPDQYSHSCKTCANLWAHERYLRLRGQILKRCSRCGQMKPLDDFHRYARSKDGHSSWCKGCYSELQLSEDRRKAKRASSHQRYLRLGEEIRHYNRERHYQIKALLVAYYSNGANRCVCCGESEVRFLTIDHINGNGSEHRKLTKCGTGATFYRWLIREGMPEGYQVLCYNCNNARMRHGTCPHQLGRKR